jgi:hypothetical protein
MMLYFVRPQFEVFVLLFITNESKDALNYLESLIGKKPTLGDYLLSIRQGEEMSQVDFARLLGISRHNLCDIEHNSVLLVLKWLHNLQIN